MKVGHGPCADCGVSAHQANLHTVRSLRFRTNLGDEWACGWELNAPTLVDSTAASVGLGLDPNAEGWIIGVFGRAGTVMDQIGFQWASSWAT